MRKHIVAGYITAYNQARRSGFATTTELEAGRNISIHFYLDGARTVTYDELVPSFSKEWAHGIKPVVNRQDPLWIVLKTRKTSYGWLSFKWGIRPGLNWVHEFIKDGTFNRFIGGSFLHYSFVTSVTGTPTEIHVTPEKLRVKLSHVRYGMDGRDQEHLASPEAWIDLDLRTARHKLVGND